MSLQRVTDEQRIGAALASLDVAVMRCEGEMGQMELGHAGEEILRLLHRNHRKVVLDLGKVDHVDYRGLPLLAARARLLRRAGGDVKLAGLSPYLVAIFRAAGVEEEFELFQSAEAAKAAFVEEPVMSLVRC